MLGDEDSQPRAHPEAEERGISLDNGLKDDDDDNNNVTPDP